MDMGYNLYQEQTQKLVMTPKLRQAITILQFSSIDLMEFIQEQINENPVIEMKDWEEYIRNYTTEKSSLEKPPKENPENFYNVIDHLSANELSLERHLLEQLQYTKELAPELKRTIKYIIGNLDEKGYLELSMEEVSLNLDVSIHMVEKTLKIVQSFEPPGIGARNLKECLMIQLKSLSVADSLIETVIQEHLVDMAENRFQKIAEQLEVRQEEVQSVADFIRTLNPRPGQSFQVLTPRYIIPDVYLEKVEGEYVVVINDRVTPKLSISSWYEGLIKSQRDQYEETKEFLHKKINSAMWLIKNIEQRKATLYKVAQSIAELQKDFLDKGVDCLKPMTLKDVAERVEMHESTISRATNNKYMQTPRGLFELKTFFTNGLSTSNGQSASVESVKRQLKQLVHDEDKKKPLSDQKIANLLQEKGISISRRTVTKYREESGIGSSAQRKRF